MAAVGAFLASGAGMALTTGISAVGTLAAGAAQKRQYEQQAAQADLRGRSEALAYKQQGVAALRNLNETLAAIVSRSASGGVDPTSGSALTLQRFALAEGAREKSISQDNQALALGQASMQAGIYRSAGRTAQLSSYASAAGSAGQAAYQYGQL